MFKPKNDLSQINIISYFSETMTSHFRKREVMVSLSFCLEKCILSFCFDLSSHAPRDEVKITYRFLKKLEIRNNVDLTSVVLRFENICNFMCFYLSILFQIIQETHFRKREVMGSLFFCLEKCILSFWFLSIE